MSPTVIAQQAQSQAPLDDQLRQLWSWANRLGLYDAADFVGRVESLQDKGGSDG